MRPKSNAVVFVGMVYPGGIVRHLALLGAEIAKCGLEADYYFASISGDREKGAWDAVRATVPLASIIETKTFGELAEACDRLFDLHDKVLIHCGGGWGQTKHFIPLRQKYGKRLILVGTTHSYRHDSWLRIPMSVFQAFLYWRYYDMIVFQCQYAADRFWGARLLLGRKKAVIIPLGCESFEDDGENPPPGIAVKKQLCGLLADKSLFKFVYLAAFRPGKMHAWLVHAITPILKQFSNARVLFCGSGDDDVVRSVREAIRCSGVEDQILLPGRISRDEVPWLLAHCDCAVVPSRAETFGHNFLEPMFAGLPVLGTRVGVGCDIIKEGETGYSIDLRNPRSVSEAAESLVADPAKTKRMGMNAKARVVCAYRHSDVAEKLTALYEQLLDE